MFNQASLALKLNAKMERVRPFDMQRFKYSFGVSFFIRSRLATTRYLRQKEKASTDTREANSKRYILYLFNYLLLLFIYLFNSPQGAFNVTSGS